jgi:hypothetical protein
VLLSVVLTLFVRELTPHSGPPVDSMVIKC